MKLYLNLFDRDSLITDRNILNSYRKEAKGKNIKHFVTISGNEIQVYSSSQLNNNRLFLDGAQIINSSILATYRKKVIGKKTYHYVTIDGQEKQVFSAAQLADNQLFLNGKQIKDRDVLATYQKKKVGKQTKHFVTIQGYIYEVRKHRQRQPLTETSNNIVQLRQSAEIEKSMTKPLEDEVNLLNASPATIINRIMNNLMSTSNLSGEAENQNEVDVAKNACDVTDEDNDGESVDQNIDAGTIIDNLMNNMIAAATQVSRPSAQPSNYSHPSAASINSPMFFASQARFQNISNDTNQNVITPSSVYDRQINCLKAISNWLNVLSLDIIQQQYSVCPTPVSNFKNNIAWLCSTLTDSLLTRLIPQDMLTRDTLDKLGQIKAFQYHSATLVDHQYLDRFIQCLENKMNTLNQYISQTTAWKSNLR